MSNTQRVKKLAAFFENMGNNCKDVVDAKLISKDLIQVTHAQPNYKLDMKQYFQSLFDLKTKQKLNTHPIFSQPQYASNSPSGSFLAQTVEAPKENSDKKKQVIQVRNQSGSIESQIVVDEFIEKILNSEVFGKPYQWNQDETKFLFIANPVDKLGTFFLDNEDENLDNVINEGLKLNKYRQDYGECMNGVYNPNLYEYNIKDQKLYQILLPDDILPCYPQYLDKKGDQIIIQGYKIKKEYKYGIIHCFNRDSDIILLQKVEKKQISPKEKKEESNKQENSKNKEKTSEFVTISEDRVCQHPMISPDLTKIIYYFSPFKGPHLNYLGIKLIDTQSLKIEKLADYSYEYKKDQFMGVCGFYDTIGDAQWLNDSRNFVFGTIEQGSEHLYILNTENKKIEKISQQLVKNKNSGITSIQEYDKNHNILFATRSSNNEPNQLYYLDFNKALDQNKQINQEKIQWENIDIYQKSDKSNFVNQITNFLQKNLEEKILTLENGVEALFWSLKEPENLDLSEVPKEIQDLWDSDPNLDPSKLTKDKRALLNIVHGGPHAFAFGTFSKYRLYFLLNGFNILAPNFTGSAGYGMKFIEDLQGKIGEADIKDINQFIDLILKDKLCDKNKIFGYGGSYGGYLCGIFASRQPDIYRGCILINSVLNIPFNVNITDIVEWNTNTALAHEEMNWNLTSEDYKIMHDKSPMRDPAQIPIIQFLGDNDRRVPYQQGLAYHAQALQNGTHSEVYVYKKGDHGLFITPRYEFDFNMKAALFVEKVDNIKQPINNYLEFVANINTQSHLNSPFYSLPVAGTINEQELILGLRSEKQISFLRSNQSQIQIHSNLDFTDDFLKIHHQISTYQLIKADKQSKSHFNVLVGFNDGLIMLVDIKNTNFIDSFNLIQNVEKQQQIFKKASVQKILVVPNSDDKQFLTLFSDNTLILYQINTITQSDAFLTEILKLEAKLNFEKNAQDFPKVRQKHESILEHGVITDPNFQCYGVFSTSNQIESLSYFKFNCCSISDIIVLPENSYVHEIYQKKEKPKYNPLIIAYTGLDGYFRIVDINNLKPLYLFQSNFGGINSIQFENFQKPICAMGCQDDSSIILNLKTQKYIRITGHKSFVSRAIFAPVDPDFIRIISSSFDCSFSIKDIERSLIDPDYIPQNNNINNINNNQKNQEKQWEMNGRQTDKMEYENEIQQQQQQQESVNQQIKQKQLQQNSQNVNFNFPVKIIYKEKDAIQLKLETEENKSEIFVINKEGIGYVECVDRYLITSAFDGCCSYYLFQQQFTEEQIEEVYQNRQKIKNQLKKRNTNNMQRQE
ncbi:WD40-repeat-containing domain [Pseudocohnilembus persalinus]|uniref:WD40-repeat-containing domain n=1 Tax=Pseudocohnilembus persalinus TaxID=266149 RepID=A0A0V0R833_PSEPJ|nr:WD40-repeat-containing domain [Pseudocohnilembus persalinus]|eukprot:KRX10653.1 WD40-repeat-containing domain [Pseudocohnilembus persalinus]